MAWALLFAAMWASCAPTEADSSLTSEPSTTTPVTSELPESVQSSSWTGGTSSEPAPSTPTSTEPSRSATPSARSTSPGSPSSSDALDTPSLPAPSSRPASPPIEPCTERAEDFEAAESTEVLPPVTFERILPEGLEHLWFNWVDNDIISFGAGMALVDASGTGRLDLFIGRHDRRDHPPCLYRNISTPGHIAFEPFEELCGSLGEYVAGLAVDLNRNGRQELVLYGMASLGLVQFYPELSYTPIHVRRAPDNPLGRCAGASALAIDLSLDGYPEVVIGCGQTMAPDLSGFGEEHPNVIFGWDHERGLVERTDPEFAAFRDPGATLAMGPIAMDDTGLDAVVFSNDAASTLFNRRTELREGVVQFRCGDQTQCAFREVPIVFDITAWGSFMGSTQLYVGDEPFVYVSDWGPNRLLRRCGGGFLDEADVRGAAVGIRNGQRVVGWAVLAEDFNFNGRDDLFVGNGILLQDPPAYAEQANAILLQRDNGTFEERTGDAGFEVYDGPFEELLGNTPSTRGGAIADLDGNGRLEIVAMNFAGPMIVYREEWPLNEEYGKRCTIVPRERTTAPLGTLIGVRGRGEESFRVRNAQGQFRAGTPASFLTTHQRGEIRFPSGAEVSFDCAGGAGPLIVREPDWVELRREGDMLQVELRRTWLPPQAVDEVNLHIRSADGSLRRVTFQEVGRTATLTTPWLADDIALMIEHGARWIPRWWTP